MDKGNRSLSRTLASLSTESRRSQLDELVRCLTESEIRRLRIQLRALDIPNDPCERFPAELLAKVADELSLDDLLRGKSVSRRWNRTFSSAEFCRRMIDKHFRCAWQYADAADRMTTTFPAHWFRRACIDRIRRQCGLYHSVTLYAAPPDISLTDDAHVECNQQYCNGRLAFQHDGIFKLIDLRSGSETNLATVNRESMRRWLLSDALIVGAVPTPSTLHAWVLASEDQGSHSVRLPGRVATLSAHYHQVGIVTFAHDVFIWDIGASVKSLQTRDALKANPEVRDLNLDFAHVFFHPFESDLHFIVYHNKPEPTLEGFRVKIRIIVQSFSLRRLISTQQFELVRDRDANWPGPRNSDNSEIVVIDAHMTGNREGDASCQLVILDMNANTISQVKLDLSHNPLLDKYSALFWRYRLIYPTRNDTCSVMVINVLQGRKDESWDAHWPSEAAILRKPRHSRDVSLGNVEALDTRRASLAEIWGDDNFLVWFDKSMSTCTVWCFSSECYAAQERRAES